MNTAKSISYDGDLHLMGMIPYMVTPLDPRPAVEQLHEGYAHGGGWHDFDGFKVEEKAGGFTIKYPGDPVYKERARITMRDEKIVIFDHGWVLVVAPGKPHRIARMD